MLRTTRTDYTQASLRRLEDSGHLLEARAYAGSIYLSGVAVESILKAFIVDKSVSIKGHNLSLLAADANISRRLRQDMRIQVDAAISEASLLWRNLFRYCSHEDLNRIGKEYKVRFQVDSKLVRYADLGEDGLMHWAERLYNLSSLIVQEGRLLWHSRKR